MSYVSVLTAARALLAAALPSFTTVDLLENAPNTLDPADYPALWLDHEEARETRFAVGGGTGAGATKKRVWELVAYLWRYEQEPAWDVSTFLGFVETVEHTLRQNNRLGGQADTATTFVLTCGEDGGDGTGIRSRTKSIPDGRAGVMRYAEVRALIREGITA